MKIAILAGVLLFLAGINGVASMNSIRDFVEEHISSNVIFQYLFLFLIFMASFGGLAVIAGGILIGKDRVRTGKFIIGLGAGAGLIGFIVSLIYGIKEGTLGVFTFLGMGAVGIILSIVARLKAKEKKL